MKANKLLCEVKGRRSIQNLNTAISQVALWSNGLHFRLSRQWPPSSNLSDIKSPPPPPFFFKQLFYSTALTSCPKTCNLTSLSHFTHIYIIYIFVVVDNVGDTETYICMLMSPVTVSMPTLSKTALHVMGELARAGILLVILYTDIFHTLI